MLGIGSRDGFWGSCFDSVEFRHPKLGLEKLESESRNGSYLELFNNVDFRRQDSRNQNNLVRKSRNSQYYYELFNVVLVGITPTVCKSTVQH